MSEEALQRANRNTALSAARDALQDAGAKAPDKLARILVDRGRVRADITEGPGHVEVRTEQGTPRINRDGDRMSLGEFAESWLDEHPEFRRDEEPSTDGADIQETMNRRTRQKVAMMLKSQRD